MECLACKDQMVIEKKDVFQQVKYDYCTKCNPAGIKIRRLIRDLEEKRALVKKRH